jgi:hypothetical protein
MAQEAKGWLCRLTHIASELTLERPPRGGLSVCAMPLWLKADITVTSVTVHY